MLIPTRVKVVVGAVSLIIAIVTLAMGYDKFGYSDTFHLIILVSIYIALTPITALKEIEFRRMRSVEEHLPDFVRDLAMMQATGMSIPHAFAEASQRDYGALTPEIKRISTQIKMGVPLEMALKAFTHRIPTFPVKRSISIIVEASRAGGDVRHILESVARDSRQIRTILKEKEGQLRPYQWTMYLAYAVFLIIVLVLMKTFLPQILAIQATMGGGALGGEVTTINQEVIAAIVQEQMTRYKYYFYYFSLAQAISAGLLSGKFVYGSIAPALKHVLALLPFSYILLFKLI